MSETLIERSKTEASPHSFVFQVGLTDKRRKRAATGNAILLDRQLGILATCAHVVNAYGSFESNIHGVWIPQVHDRACRTECRKQWVNWGADIALLRLADASFAASCEDATLCFDGGIGLAPATVQGFINERPVVRQGRVLERYLGYAVNLVTFEEVMALKDRWFVPREDKRKLFEKYLLVSSSDTFEPGMSGSAVLDDCGRLLGMLSASNSSSMALAIPALEIQDLMRKNMFWL